ncbi:hypothetical protein ACIFOE_26500, partial [Paenibacillus sp. NRS-1783]
ALLLFVAAVPHPDKISANTSTKATRDTGTTTTGDHVITPQKGRDVFNDTFDRKDPVSRFVLDRGYGHLKIYLKNKGNSTITFSQCIRIVENNTLLREWALAVNCPGKA